MSRDLYELMTNNIPSELQGFWKIQIPRYVTSAKLQLPYSEKELQGTLKWVVGEWVLELENINWEYTRERGGMAAVSRELDQQAKQIWESALYWVEKSFGYAEEYQGRPKSQGEALGQQLWEIFRRNEDEFFGKMGEDLRASEFAKSKTTTKRFVFEIERWIRIQITRHGFG